MGGRRFLVYGGDSGRSRRAGRAGRKGRRKNDSIGREEVVGTVAGKGLALMALMRLCAMFLLPMRSCFILHSNGACSKRQS